MKARVLLADDHRMMREGLRALLEREADLEVVGEAADGREVLRAVRELHPDVVIMDIGMPSLNGLDATRQLAIEAPQTKVIALSTHSDKRYVLGMVEAGAAGYLLKESAAEELLRAIRAVMRGQKYLSAETAGTVIDGYRGRDFPDEGGPSVLGTREREVLQLLAEGKSSPEIARLLFVSVSTVETHRRNIMRKLDIHSVAELTKYAIRHGITTA